MYVVLSPFDRTTALGIILVDDGQVCWRKSCQTYRTVSSLPTTPALMVDPPLSRTTVATVSIPKMCTVVVVREKRSWLSSVTVLRILVERPLKHLTQGKYRRYGSPAAPRLTRSLPVQMCVAFFTLDHPDYALCVVL